MINKKILCIGNETEHSDQLVSVIATKELTINFDILRIDNPNIYITPNNPDTNYALIT